MVLFGQIAASRRVLATMAGVALFAGASILATTGSASAAPDHRGRFVGPGFHGRPFHPTVWRGRGFYPGFPGYGRYRRGFYPAIFPGYGYYGTPYVRYYYPQYVYPTYVMPTAVYAMPPRPPMATAPARGREFTVYFDFDRYELTGDARRVVDGAIAEARAGGPARITIIGNTDLAGTNSYNDVLSRHRAETVRNYMVAHGVNSGEIDIQARGKADPAVRTADGVREPRNRRVEIVVSPESGPQYNQPPATSMRAPPPYYNRPVAPANATMAPPPPTGQPTNLLNNQ